MMIFKGYRLSFMHFVLYISTFIIGVQLWSVWKQSSHGGFPSYSQRGWEFDADVQSNVHTFSNEQCDVAFPQLYHSLDKAVKRRNGRKVHVQDIEINKGRCMLRVMIYQGEVSTTHIQPSNFSVFCFRPRRRNLNRTSSLTWPQLFVVNSGQPEDCYVANGNERERILGTLAQIDRALSTSPISDPSIPNIEFSLSLDDLPRRSKGKGIFFGYTRQDSSEYDDIWLIPNYAYWSWNYTHAPSWNSIRREIADAEREVPWEKKDPRVVWRGKVKMAQLRSELVRVSEGKSWSDIKPVVINDAKDKHTKDVMNLRDFCGYVKSACTVSHAENANSGNQI